MPLGQERCRTDGPPLAPLAKAGLTLRAEGMALRAVGKHWEADDSDEDVTLPV